MGNYIGKPEVASSWIPESNYTHTHTCIVFKVKSCNTQNLTIIIKIIHCLDHSWYFGGHYCTQNHAFRIQADNASRRASPDTVIPRPVGT